MRVLGSQALQRAKVIGIAKRGAQFLEDRPIARARLFAAFAPQLATQVILKTIIVEQSVVDVKKKDNVGADGHRNPTR